ncbi:MAG TPA: ABC transporter permease [Trebonia sp.]|nr:ABC transporter permease [Trebonia sp.]
MSETTQSSPGVVGSPPGRDARAGGNRSPLGMLQQLARQREAAVFVIAVLTFVAFWLANSAFVSSTTLSITFNYTFPAIIIIALGEVLLLISGEIDLSVGFMVGFAPFMAYFLDAYYHVPALLAVVIGLLLGVIVGWVNGFLTVTIGVPSFITTLGTGFILWGVMLYTSHAEPVPVPANMANFGHWLGGGNKYSWLIWAVVLTLIFHTLLTRTRWGLHTVSVGGNLLGAREAGISVAKIKYGNFMLTGVLGALVGFQTMYYTATIDPNSASYTPMFNAVTAAVIGGTAMLGGSGTIMGAFFGAIVLANLSVGFAVQGVSANVIYVIDGAAILIAMVANVQLTRLRERGGR